jgi:hypothetical protein
MIFHEYSSKVRFYRDLKADLKALTKSKKEIMAIQQGGTPTESDRIVPALPVLDRKRDLQLGS